jgi:hypothetical protein
LIGTGVFRHDGSRTAGQGQSTLSSSVTSGRYNSRHFAVETSATSRIH